MSEAIIDVGAVLDRQKITGFNIGLVILAFLVMMTDGYDLGAAAFAGPGLIKEWGLRGPELGVLLSSSLAAGFFGPPLLGYLADRFGRKRVIVCGAYAFGLFTLSAVATSSLNQLVLTRILTGIALAGTLPIMVALINEFAPKRSRATMVVLMFTGVTFGGGLPGLIAAKFMAAHGWRILFWVGGIAPLVIATVLLVALPESVKYLTLHPARRDELIALLKRIDPSLPIGADTRFVISSEQNKARFSFGALLAGPARRADAALLGVKPHGIDGVLLHQSVDADGAVAFRRQRSSRPRSPPRCSSSAARWQACCRCAFSTATAFCRCRSCSPAPSRS